jgi:hypothetical protein
VLRSGAPATPKPGLPAVSFDPAAAYCRFDNETLGEVRMRRTGPD